jgi:hypothetical protein
MQWNFTKNLKFDFTANNEGRILEPIGKIDTQRRKRYYSTKFIGH